MSRHRLFYIVRQEQGPKGERLLVARVPGTCGRGSKMRNHQFPLTEVWSGLERGVLTVTDYGGVQ